MTEAMLGFIVGVAFMKIMWAFALRPCCERHFSQHVKGDRCLYGTCTGTPNHYGYCNLHVGVISQ